MPRSQLLVLSLLLAVPLALTGCSADGGDASASPTADTQAGGTTGSAAEPTAAPVGTPDVSTPREDAVTPGTSGVDEGAAAAGDLSADQLDAVTTDEAVSVSDTVVVSIDPMSATELEAGPGEVGGAGIVVPVRVTNQESSEVSLSGLVTVLTYGPDKAPAVEVVTASDEVPASLAPGQTLVIERAFSVPVEGRDQVQVVVDLGADYPAAVFEGSGPR